MPPSGVVDDLVELSRLLVSTAVRSLDAAGAAVTLPQFRALALLARTGPCTSGGLAAGLGQHGSTVTRLGDRLVAAGWVTRQNRQDNRREVELALTPAGQELVTRVLTARAAELENLLARLPAADRDALAAVLPRLLAAAGGDEQVRSDWVV